MPRVIIGAYRSTLATPTVLAKPVTAGPTPCGPSFTPAPIPNPPSSPSTLVILTPAPTPLPFPPPPTPTDGGPTLTRTQPSLYPTIDNPAPDFFPLPTPPPPYLPLLTDDNDFPTPPPDLNAQVRQLRHQLQLATLQAPVVHIPENNLDPGSTVCVTWKNKGEDDTERGPEWRGTPPGQTNPAPQMTRREGVRGPLGAIALKPPTQGNRANPQAAAPPRVNHHGGPKYTMGTGVFPHGEEQGVPQTPPSWLHQALPAPPNCGRTPTPCEGGEELTTKIIEREEKPAGTVPYTSPRHPSPSRSRPTTSSWWTKTKWEKKAGSTGAKKERWAGFQRTTWPR